MNFLKHPLLLLISAVLVTSCAVNISSRRPKAEVSTMVLAQKKESIISLPLSLETSTLQNFVNKELPSELYSGPIEEGTIRVIRDGNIQFSTKDDKLEFIVPLRIYAHLCKSVKVGPINVSKCGDGEAGISAKIVSSINLNEDYKIITNTQLFSNLNDAHLKIDFGFFDYNFNIKSLIEGQVRKATEKFQGKIDEMIAAQINKLDIKKQLNTYWTKLGQPININKMMFVEIEPKSLLFRNVKSINNKIEIKVGVSSNISMVSSNPKTFNTALPKLQISNSIDNKFHVYLPIYLEFDSLCNKLNKEIANKTFTDNEKKYEVSVSNTEMYGSGNSIIIGLDFKANAKKLHTKAKGRLYFVAIPEYDTLKKILKVKDFKLSLETGSLLNDKGIGWLTNSFYKDKIKELLKYDLGKNISSFKATINERLKEVKLDKLVVNGKIDNLNFEGFQFDQGGINVIISGEGTLNSQMSSL